MGAEGRSAQLMDAGARVFAIYDLVDLLGGLGGYRTCVVLRGVCRNGARVARRRRTGTLDDILVEAYIDNAVVRPVARSVDEFKLWCGKTCTQAVMGPHILVLPHGALLRLDLPRETRRMCTLYNTLASVRKAVHYVDGGMWELEARRERRRTHKRLLPTRITLAHEQDIAIATLTAYLNKPRLVHGLSAKQRAAILIIAHAPK